MPPQPSRHSHVPVTQTPSTSSTVASTPVSPEGPISVFPKPPFFSWRILGGIFATMLVVGWVFIIVILIREEKWQLVLVAWLLLYAAAHFCYWYFKRHHLLSIQSQICGRSRPENGGILRTMEKGRDSPPSYDDIIKSEPPPPTYYSVVEGSPKTSFQKSASSSGHQKFSLQGFPNVFAKNSSYTATAAPSTSHTPGPSTSRNDVASSMVKNSSERKHSSYNVCPPSISGSLPAPQPQPHTWKPSAERGEPPSYSESFVDVESHVIASTSFPSPRRSNSRNHSHTDSVINEALHPIFSPIYKNTAAQGKLSNTSRPTTVRESNHKSVNNDREKHCPTPIS